MALTRRLAYAMPVLDFGKLLQDIHGEGITIDAIAEILSVKPQTVRAVMLDTRPEPPGWQDAVRLIDLYLRVTHEKNLPWIKP